MQRMTADHSDLLRLFLNLISLDLTECRCDSADELGITPPDTDGQLASPAKGARINVQIGWQESGLVDKGIFTVDEIEHSGAPDVLTLRARTASLIDTFRQPVECSFS